MYKQMLFMLLLALFATGCEREIEAGGSERNTITATMPPDPDPETRTSLNGKEILWSEGDEIAVYDVSDKSLTPYKYTLESGAGEKTATFHSSNGTAANKILAIYPYSAIINSIYPYVGMNVPSSTTQKFVDGNIQTRLMTMTALGDRNALSFQSECSVLRFEVSSPSITKKLSKLYVSSDDIIQAEMYVSAKDRTKTSSTAFPRYSLVYSFENTSIGVEKKTINILTRPCTLENVEFRLVAEDGQEAYSKIGTIDAKAGTSFVCETENKLIFSDPVVAISIDGGESKDWTSGPLSEIPTSSIKLKSVDGSVLKEDLLLKLDTLLSKSNGNIDIDFSAINYFDPQWSFVFTIGKSKLKDFVLPLNISSIRTSTFSSSVDTLFIGDKVETIAERICDAANRIKFKVSSGNKIFKSDDVGALYGNDTILRYAPRDKLNYVVSSTVTQIGESAFLYMASLKTLTIPSTVNKMNMFSIYGCSVLDTIDLSQCPVPPTATYIHYCTSPGLKAPNRVIVIPKSSESLYKNASGWKDLTGRSNNPYTFYLQ